MAPLERAVVVSYRPSQAFRPISNGFRDIQR